VGGEAVNDVELRRLMEFWAGLGPEGRGLGRFWEEVAARTGRFPDPLPCGCYLGLCPCCKKKVLVVGGPKGCSLGGPRDSRHKQYVRRHAKI
jgi:hypothetical protein